MQRGINTYNKPLSKLTSLFTLNGRDIIIVRDNTSGFFQVT